MNQFMTDDNDYILFSQDNYDCYLSNTDRRPVFFVLTCKLRWVDDTIKTVSANSMESNL